MATAVQIKKVEIKGLRSKYDCTIELKAGANIFHGENGSFKTTIANILALIASGDFRRIGYYEPNSVVVYYSDDSKIQANYSCRPVRDHKHYDCSLKVNEEESEKQSYFCPRNDKYGYHSDDQSDIDLSKQGQVIYYPSFRLLIDSARTNDEKRKRVLEILGFWPDALSRQIGLAEIISRIDSRYGEYLQTRDSITSNALDILLGASDIQMLPPKKLNNFTEFEEKVTELLDSDSTDKRQMLNEISKSIRGLKDRARTTEYKSLFTLIDNINGFLKRKNLNVDSATNASGSDGLISLLIDDQRIVRDDIPKALSAGERQIVTLLYHFSECDADTTLIVDEPEISLDINWQQKLGKLLTNIKANQAIVFTHSAGFASRFEGSVIGRITIDENRITLNAGD